MLDTAALISYFSGGTATAAAAAGRDGAGTSAAAGAAADASATLPFELLQGLDILTRHVAMRVPDCRTVGRSILFENQSSNINSMLKVSRNL